MAQEKDDKLQTIDPASDISGLELTPIYSNRYRIWANEEIFRFAIGDYMAGGSLHYRHSFVMTRSDAASLTEMLKDLLAETDPAKPKTK